MFRPLVWLALAVMLALLAAAPGGTAKVSVPRQLAFDVSLDGHVVPCVAGADSVPAARRLSGTIGFAAEAWSPEGTRIALSGGPHVTNPIRVAEATS